MLWTTLRAAIVFGLAVAAVVVADYALTGLRVPVDVDGLLQPPAPVEARLRSPGRSIDLLCDAAPQSPAMASLPENVTAAQLHCPAQGMVTQVHHVTLDGDRRRSLVLPAGTGLRFDAPASGASWLRFSIASLSEDAPGFRLTVTDDDGSQRVWTAAEAAETAGWVDAQIDVSELSSRCCSVDLKTELKKELKAEASTLSAADPRGLVAWATPRWVVPETEADDTVASPKTGQLPAGHVVLYLSDTLRPDHMSLYGYERPTTPVIDRLAASGLVFDNAYSTTAWTRPATASLLTSLYPSVHGSDEIRGLPQDVTTLAERFRAAGFSTVAVVANGNVHAKGLGFEQGFDRFVAMPSLRAQKVHARVVRQLESLRGEPFFLYVHTIDPHTPYSPPDGYRGTFTDPDYAGGLTPATANRKHLGERTVGPADLDYVRGLYDEEIHYQDAMLGELFEDFGALGVAERMVFVFTSDHGEEFLEHGGWEHGLSLYEEQVRVPLWWTAPIPGLAGRRIEEPVQILDVMPTLLGWYGIDCGSSCQGWNLDGVASAGGELRQALAERPMYCEEIRYGYKWDRFSLLRGDSKLIQYVAPKDAFRWHRFFDLGADPGEHDNRVAGIDPRFERLRREVESIPHRLQDGVAAYDPAAEAELDAESRRQLEALGYLEAEADDE